jgi:hypothetical protein
MKKIALLIIAVLPYLGKAQENKLWTEGDRKYLLDNLTRSRDELVKETQDLSKEQLTFKESPERWSINQIVEHIAIWELLFDREISMALVKPQPELNQNAKPDAYYLDFIMETKPHISVEYTKPFTFTLPLGLNETKNNMAWFLKMRNESIEFVKIAQEDFRSHYLRPGRGNVHQTYINVFGHTDRHLRQIRKVKQHANYPK